MTTDIESKELLVELDELIDKDDEDDEDFIGPSTPGHKSHSDRTRDSVEIDEELREEDVMIQEGKLFLCSLVVRK